MAHAATLDDLAEHLVTAVTSKTPRNSSFKKLKTQALRGVRDQTHARTNQFAVQDKLHGLIEKFAVLNRDDLSEELQSRLERLPKTSRWTPEILSLLLELSDQPAQKTSLQNVKNANPDHESATRLTWDDIIAADPLSEPDIWDDIERGYHSSEDDEVEDEDSSESTSSSRATSIDDDPASLARLHLAATSESSLSEVRTSRDFWISNKLKDGNVRPPELTTIREVLSMAHGLPTNLFSVDELTGSVALNGDTTTMCTASRSCSEHLLLACASLGTAVNRVRYWCSGTQHFAHLQSMQNLAREHLSTFDQSICHIEQSFVEPVSDTTVSIIDVHTRIENLATPLVRFAGLLSAATQKDAPFALLDLLYEALDTTQMSDNADLVVSMLLDLFLSSLQTYLRSVSDWVCEGRIHATNKDAFFVVDGNASCDPGKLWSERYAVQSKSDGATLAPSSLGSSIDLIFKMGKDRFLLNQLSQREDHDASRLRAHRSTPPLADLARRLKFDPLLPFSELLSESVEQWLLGLNTDYAQMLCSSIRHDCGLMQSLRALPYVFFSKNGSATQDFMDSLVNYLTDSDTVEPTYLGFVLTELAAHVFGTLPGVDAENFYVGVSDLDSSDFATSLVTAIGCVDLSYALSWPVQNVTRCRSPQWHAKVFAFLLQIQYTSSLLEGRFFDLRSQSPVSGTTLKLRQRLLSFVNTLQSHLTMTASVLHEATTMNLGEAVDVDAMIDIWFEYERSVQLSLLVAPKLIPLRQAITSNLELGELLCSNYTPRDVATLFDHFKQNVAFVVSGIRSIGRVEGDAALDVLAERLEWTIT